MFLLLLQRLSLQFLLDAVLFPVWWYTAGAKAVGVGLWHWFLDANVIIAPALWLKNIFVPMFGQTDWQGRLTSFFVRFFNVVFRSVALLLWFFVLCILFLMWLIAPVVVLWMFVFNIGY